MNGNSASQSFEERLISEYLHRAQDEADASTLTADDLRGQAILAAQGFEERSVGFLEMVAERGLRAKDVIIATYSDHRVANNKYRKRFEHAADAVAETKWRRVTSFNDAQWVDRALALTEAEKIILDITGISNRALFNALDAIARSGRCAFIAYTEAGEYWPTYTEWIQLRDHLLPTEDVGEEMDKRPWLFGHEHRCELIAGHEGYDSAGSSRAMVAFLHFKAARLAAVLGEEEYAAFVFVAGRPRLQRNQWRLDALKAINANVVRSRQTFEMDTFGYRNALRQLSDILFSNPGVMRHYDVHMASMGSKLQEVSCWIASCLLQSITLVASVPTKYYPKAFSNGIGAKWTFPLLLPSGTGRI